MNIWMTSELQYQQAAGGDCVATVLLQQPTPDEKRPRIATELMNNEATENGVKSGD